MMENVLKKEGKSLFMGEENVLKRKNRKRIGTVMFYG